MESSLIIAIVAAFGAILGIVVTTIGQIARDCLHERSAKRSDKRRIGMLKEMLNYERYTWRKLSTLSHVIGADESITKELLIELGARGSEDGSDLWGLISRNPFPTTQ
jgi:hypothetical protein